MLNVNIHSRERSMSDAELCSCRDTHHFIRGKVDKTRQDEEITEPKTLDKQKLFREDRNETDLQFIHHYLIRRINNQECVICAVLTIKKQIQTITKIQLACNWFCFREDIRNLCIIEPHPRSKCSTKIIILNSMHFYTIAHKLQCSEIILWEG